MTGANSIEEIPNIADLYDKNCPTDLTDHFSEIYESEWANALKELIDQKSKTEEEAIRILFDIFQVLNYKCVRYSIYKLILQTMKVSFTGKSKTKYVSAFFVDFSFYIYIDMI